MPDITPQEILDFKDAIAECFPGDCSLLLSVEVDDSDNVQAVFEDNLGEDGLVKRYQFTAPPSASDGKIYPTYQLLDAKPLDNDGLFAGLFEYRAVIDRVINAGGLRLGVQYLPGQVRFPSTSHAKKLRCGYGHLRGYRDEHGRSPRAFIHPAFFSANPPDGASFFQLFQSLGDGVIDEKKILVMPPGASVDDARSLYAREMPEQFIERIKPIALSALDDYKRIKLGQQGDHAEPLSVSGGLLSDTEWDQIAEVTQDDIDQAIAEMLDAFTDEGDRAVPDNAFAEALAEYDPEILQQLADIINGDPPDNANALYPDIVDRVIGYRVDGDALLVAAIDGRKRLAFKLMPQTGRFQSALLNPGDMDQMFEEPPADFAAKPGSKPKQKNCKHLACPGPKGVRCMPAGGKCSGKMTTKQAAAAQSAMTAVGGGAAPAPAMKPATTIDEMNQALKDLAEGKPAKLSNAAELDATDWMKQQVGYSTYNLDKQYKMLKVANNLTDQESAALALWLGSGYKQMSKQIWMQEANPSFKPDPKILAASVLAAQALHKLPRQTADDWAQRMHNWSLSKGTLAGVQKAANGTWNRYMTIDEAALQGFMQKYKDGKGKEIVEGNFMGITHLKEPKMSYFSSGANVVYRIKPKTDGTSQGKYVDDFKNGNKEGEILYPPGTKFRVKKVTEVKALTPEEQNFFDTYKEITAGETTGALSPQKIKEYKEEALKFSGLSSWSEYKSKYGKSSKVRNWHSVFQPNGYLIELEEV